MVVGHANGQSEPCLSCGIVTPTASNITRSISQEALQHTASTNRAPKADQAARRLLGYSRGAQQGRVRTSCPRSFSEMLFREILGGLLGSGSLPPGSIIDAGANDGTDSCFYAEAARSRIVHAVEPLAQNVEAIEQLARHVPNLRPMLGGLGNSRRLVYPSVEDASRPSGVRAQISNFNEQGWSSSVSSARGKGITPFQVERIDDLFFGGNWSHESLGFAHFDLEGGELSVLEGAERTIRRDRPIFTVEVNVHREPATTAALLRRISSFGYIMFAVQENCGAPWADCRNVMAFPSDWLKQQQHTLHADGAAVLNLAHLGGQLVQVTAENIAHRSGYPACQKGGECCRGVEKGKERLGPCPCLISCVQHWWRNQPNHVTAGLARPEWDEQKAGLRPFFAELDAPPPEPVKRHTGTTGTRVSRRSAAAHRGRRHGHSVL